MRWLIAVTVLAMPAVALAQAVTPGEWDIAITTDSITMPDMPPEIAKSMAGKTTHIRHCITPAEAALGPQALLKSTKECAFTRYTVLGGHLHAEMTCKQGSGTMHSVSDGSFTATSFRTSGKTVMTGDTPMTMAATTVGTRTGACAK